MQSKSNRVSRFPCVDTPDGKGGAVCGAQDSTHVRTSFAAGAPFSRRVRPPCAAATHKTPPPEPVHREHRPQRRPAARPPRTSRQTSAASRGSSPTQSTGGSRSPQSGPTFARVSRRTEATLAKEAKVAKRRTVRRYGQASQPKHPAVQRRQLTGPLGPVSVQCVEKCAGEDLNLHGPFGPQGPQPCASTNSATSAWRSGLYPLRAGQSGYLRSRKSATVSMNHTIETAIVSRVRLRSTMWVPPCEVGVKPSPPSPPSRPECMRMSTTRPT